MPRFTDPKALAKYLKKAADATVAESIITTQARLGSTNVSPYRDGRFRSSWFAAEGTPSRAEPSEKADAANTDANGLQVDARKTYYLSSSLPYTQSVTIEGRVVSKPTTWFKDFRDSAIPKIQKAAAETVKREYDLT